MGCFRPKADTGGRISAEAHRHQTKSGSGQRCHPPFLGGGGGAEGGAEGRWLVVSLLTPP